MVEPSAQVVPEGGDGDVEHLGRLLVGPAVGVHEEDGCLLYAIHDASDGTITMLEKWESPEALAAHAAGDAVKALNAAIADHIAAPTTVTTMTPLPAGTEAQGVL